MRDRPFLPASESPRPFSDVRAERGDGDEWAHVWREVAALEADAAGAETPEEAHRLQCQAEELRCGIYHQPRKSPGGL